MKTAVVKGVLTSYELMLAIYLVTCDGVLDRMATILCGPDAVTIRCLGSDHQFVFFWGGQMMPNTFRSKENVIGLRDFTNQCDRVTHYLAIPPLSCTKRSKLKQEMFELIGRDSCFWVRLSSCWFGRVLHIFKGKGLSPQKQLTDLYPFWGCQMIPDAFQPKSYVTMWWFV
jgi:hypothetical protein